MKDKEGNAVVFSIITNSGNKARERMATLIQEDLQKVGIHVNVVTLDFPSLIERMTQIVRLRSHFARAHQRRTRPQRTDERLAEFVGKSPVESTEKVPETAWEAEIDRLMRAQAPSADPKKRKEAFDRVQEIAVEQAPFIFLVNRNALSAVAAKVQDAAARHSGAADVLERRPSLSEVGIEDV